MKEGPNLQEQNVFKARDTVKFRSDMDQDVRNAIAEQIDTTAEHTVYGVSIDEEAGTILYIGPSNVTSEHVESFALNDLDSDVYSEVFPINAKFLMSTTLK